MATVRTSMTGERTVKVSVKVTVTALCALPESLEELRKMDDVSFRVSPSLKTFAPIQRNIVCHLAVDLATQLILQLREIERSDLIVLIDSDTGIIHISASQIRVGRKYPKVIVAVQC